MMERAKVWMERGIPLDGRPAQMRMAQVGGAVAAGARAASTPDVSNDRIAREMDAIELELRGFAWEGVGTSLTVADVKAHLSDSTLQLDRSLMPRAHALAQANPTWRKWIIMGIGLGFARTFANAMDDADHGYLLNYVLHCSSVDAMIICDGLGMALASGNPDRWLAPTATLSNLIKGKIWSTEAADLLRGSARGFDQGVGRAIWFVNCGEPEKIVSTLSEFAESPRLPDLWGGVGFAGTYAGGVPEAQWRDLVARAPAFRPYLAQAAACVAHSRLKTSGAFQETEIGCGATWGRSAHDTVNALRHWLEHPNEVCVAAAPDDWRHIRFLTEFPDHARVR
jgi:hypothetical protein